MHSEVSRICDHVQEREGMIMGEMSEKSVSECDGWVFHPFAPIVWDASENSRRPCGHDEKPDPKREDEPWT